MLVFVLVCLFWAGMISLAATPVGTVLVLLILSPVALLFAELHVPATLFGILFIAAFVVPAVFNAVSGTLRAIRGEASAWSAWSWAVSFAAIPLILFRAFATFNGGLH